MRVRQLAASFKGLELFAQLRDSDDLGDGVCDAGRSNEIFVVALRILDDEADGDSLLVQEGVRKADLRGLELLLVCDVFLAGEDQPQRNRIVGRVLFVGKKVGFGGLSPVAGERDMLQQRAGRF